MNAHDLWELMVIPRDGLGRGTKVRVRVIDDAATLDLLFAQEIAGVIQDNNRLGRSTCCIVPVGPIGQYEPLVRIIDEKRIDCSRVTFVNMDEFLDDTGRWIEPSHPLSFRGFMDRAFYRLVPAEAKFSEENRVFPDPQDPEAAARLIAARGGVDVAFGGIGLNGHLAFNEPDDVRVEEFASCPARVVDLAPASRAHMAVNLSCALDLVPRRAVTLGMREILGARRLSLYANRPWQCGVVRQALHGPVTPACPASYLQRHPNAMLTMAAYVAEAREIRLR